MKENRFISTDLMDFIFTEEKFDPNQPRDNNGMWTDGEMGNGGKNLKEFENSIRGQAYESAAVYDSEGNIILEKDGDHNSVHFTKDEMTKMMAAGLTKETFFTHNHPKGYSFSKEDVLMLHKLNLKEMRAVSEGITHILTKNPEGKTEYMMQNGLAGYNLLRWYQEAKNDAMKITDKTYNDHKGSYTDAFLSSLNYDLYHKTIEILVNRKELKGWLIYKTKKG